GVARGGTEGRAVAAVGGAIATGAAGAEGRTAGATTTGAGATAAAVVAVGVVGAAGCGHGLDDLAEQVALEDRQGEPPGHGAITVIAQGQPALGPGGFFFLGYLAFFVGID